MNDENLDWVERAEAELAPSAVTLAAARAVLAVHEQWVSSETTLIEHSAWLLGAAGEPLPTLRGAQNSLHARMAAAAGRGDSDGLVAVLREHLPEAAGRDLLKSACRLAGRRWPQALVSVAAEHPGRELDGRWLVGTPDREALLALLPWKGNGRPDGLTTATVGELMIAAHDRGELVDVPTQRLWAALQADHPEHLAAYRDPVLRLAARSGLEPAVTLLQRWEAQFGRAWIADGAHAVVARIARVDPDRGVALVAASAEPADRVEWLPGLAWWLELTPAAAPMVRELLAREEPEIATDLIALLAGTSELELLDRAVAGARRIHRPLTIATALATGVRRWSSAVAVGAPAEVIEVAARVRAHCRRALATEPLPGDMLAAADVFEVLGAVRPWQFPWDPSPPGVP